MHLNLIKRHSIVSLATVSILLHGGLARSAQSSVSVQQRMQQLQQAQQQEIERLARGIVRIEAEKDVKDTGTGIVLTSAPGSVTILTALHVVDGARSISVFFYDNRMKPFTARKLPKHSTALDLAVLEVDAAPGISVPADLPKFNFAANATIQLTQHIWSVNGEWNVVPNNLTRLSHDGDPQKFEYSNVSVGEGFSGGPIFNDYEDIIGMHDALNGDGSYAIGVKIDSALQVLEALDYTVPKAGPVVLPAYAALPSSLRVAPTSPVVPCGDGCEITFGSLKRVGHYRAALSGGACEEDVYPVPSNWPGAGLFFHVLSCAVTHAGRPQRVVVYFAQTDHEGDQDAMIGIATLLGSSGQGVMKDTQGGHWKLTLRNPNFGGVYDLNAVSIAIAPFLSARP
jgi:hypothetical protein